MKNQTSNNGSLSILSKSVNAIKNAWTSYMCMVKRTNRGYRMYEDYNAALCNRNINTAGSKTDRPKQLFFDDYLSTY